MSKPTYKELEKRVKGHKKAEAEHKVAVDTLRESEEFHRITLNSISDAVFLTDDKGEFTFICGNVEIIFGYSEQEIQKFNNISKILGDEIFDINELDALGEIENIEKEITDKDGRAHSLLVNVKRVSIKGGTTLITCRDITERKRAEESIQTIVKSTAGTIGQDYFDNIVSSICEWLGTEAAIIGEITDGNDVRTLSMQVDGKNIPDYKYSLPGTPCNNVTEEGFCIYPENICELFPEDKYLVEMGAVGYVGILLRDKNNVPIGILNAISRHKLDIPEHTKEIMGIIGAKASAEIERKKAEDALTFERNKFNSILNQLPIGVSVLDADGKYVYYNPISIKIDQSKEVSPELTGKNVMSNHPKKVRQVIEEILRDFKSGKSSYYLREAKRGKKTVETIYHSLRSEEGEYLGLIRLISDITEQKTAEKEKLLHDYGERVKELTGLYSLGQLETQTNNLEELFCTFTRDIVPLSMQFPDKTFAIIELDDKKYCSCGKDELCDSILRLSSPILIKGKKRGVLSIGYSEDLPFKEKYEQNLIDGYSERLGKIVERIESANALRKAHDKLEIRVKERTAELESININLKNEIEEHKKAKEIDCKGLLIS